MITAANFDVHTVSMPEGEDALLNYGQTLRKHQGDSPTAIEAQAQIVEVAHAPAEPLMPDENGVVPEPAYRTPTGRRPKGSVLKVVPDHIKEMLLTEYDAGEIGMVALAVKYNIQPPVLRDFLVTENGRTVKKGRKAGSGSAEGKAPRESSGKKFGRARSTLLELAPEQIEEAVALFKAGQGGCVSLAKDYNVQPATMKEYLVAAGCEVKKGRKAISKVEEVISLGGETSRQVEVPA